jgi:hypothetical protein
VIHGSTTDHFLGFATDRIILTLVNKLLTVRNGTAETVRMNQNPTTESADWACKPNSIAVWLSGLRPTRMSP